MLKKTHLMSAFGELLLVIVTLSFSAGYEPPPKIKKVMKTPEFTAFVVFSVLYSSLGQDLSRAALWSIVFLLTDRYFRNKEETQDEETA